MDTKYHARFGWKLLVPHPTSKYSWIQILQGVNVTVFVFISYFSLLESHIQSMLQHFPAFSKRWGWQFQVEPLRWWTRSCFHGMMLFLSLSWKKLSLLGFAMKVFLSCPGLCLQFSFELSPLFRWLFWNGLQSWTHHLTSFKWSSL